MIEKKDMLIDYDMSDYFIEELVMCPQEMWAICEDGGSGRYANKIIGFGKVYEKSCVYNNGRPLSHEESLQRGIVWKPLYFSGEFKGIEICDNVIAIVFKRPTISDIKNINANDLFSCEEAIYVEDIEEKNRVKK